MVTLGGVDVEWMQAQWRDCADKGVQLGIFRDMCGKKVTVQEILDAVGEPAYCGPIDQPKAERRKWTQDEDARIAEMVCAGDSHAKIAEELGRTEYAVAFHINLLKKRGMIANAGGSAQEETAPETIPEKGLPGDALPLELGDLPGLDALNGVNQTIRALLDEEEMLCERLKIVREHIARYRKELTELLMMAGGDPREG